MTLISSSPMIMPPMVMRICFRCMPYTGRMISRSNTQPSAPATAMATSMAGNKRHEVEPQAVGLGVAGHAGQHRGGHEGTERDEHAVAEVEHVHEAEHQREARGDDEDDHAHGQPRHGERDPGGSAAHGGQCDQRQRGHQRERLPVEVGFEKCHWCAPRERPSKPRLHRFIGRQFGHATRCAPRGRRPSRPRSRRAGARS